MLNKFPIVLLLIILLSPFLVLIGLIIFVLTLENPIFIQERGLTLSKYRFRIYKFRTLTEPVSSENGDNLLNKTKYNHRLLPFGKFLRRTGLDELPQLFNILKGEMNFIGPRPLDIEDLTNIKNHFFSSYIEREKIDLLPGVTGYWQVYKDETKTVKNLVELDKYYEKNSSFSLDVDIFFSSFSLAIKGQNDNLIFEDSTCQGSTPQYVPLEL